MYSFAIVALMALAVIKVVDFLTDNLAGLERARTALTFVGALVAMMALDFDLFAEWGIVVRSGDIGVWMTGFIVAGMTVPWRALFGFLTHDKATRDETLGEHHPLLERAA